jgi:iron(III) transport system ATP-binding protein
VSRSAALVTLTEVGKRYGRRQAPAVTGLSFTVGHGEIVALLGPSGCGKTTMLRLIAGFEAPDEGVIAIDGRVVADAASGSSAPVPPEARGVGVVFQDYARGRPRSSSLTTARRRSRSPIAWGSSRPAGSCSSPRPR